MIYFLWFVFVLPFLVYMKMKVSPRWYIPTLTNGWEKWFCKTSMTTKIIKYQNSIFWMMAGHTTVESLKKNCFLFWRKSFVRMKRKMKVIIRKFRCPCTRKQPKLKVQRESAHLFPICRQCFSLAKYKKSLVQRAWKLSLKGQEKWNIRKYEYFGYDDYLVAFEWWPSILSRINSFIIQF